MPHIPVHGEHLGPYRVERALARGGMGLVFLAYDPNLHRWVALKVLRPELVTDAATARVFLQEAQAAAILNHPNIVRIYSAGEQGGLVYFAMELVEGATLEAELQRERQLEPRRAAELIRQAARGLQHAFQNKIIHGDIKPGNLLVAADGTVKLTDFGLARHVHMVPPAGGGEFYGTPEYLSPEVAQGQPGDQRSDIYSLGITLYYLLTGRRPFLGPTPETILRQQVRMAPVPVRELRPQVPATLSQLVDKMLAKNPADRPQDYGEVLTALDAALRMPRAVTELRTAPRPPAAADKPIAPVTTAANKPLAPAPIVAPPPTAPPQHEHSVAEFALTAFAVVVVLGLGGFFFYKKIHNLAANRTSAPAGQVTGASPEARAAAALMPLTSAANKLISAGRFGEAWKVYDRFDANRYAQTHAVASVQAAREQILESAGKAIALTREQAQTAALKKNFTDAINRWDQCAAACQGIEPLAPMFAEELLRALADRQNSAIQIQAQLSQLDKQAGSLVVTLQWDKLRDNLRAAADLPSSFAARQMVAALADEAGSLERFRSNILARAKAGHGPTLRLATAAGPVQGQLVELTAQSLSLRQPLGDSGFGERAIAWKELPPATVASIFNLCLDVANLEEVLAFGALTVRQALAHQAKVADAQATLQSLQELAPGHADLIAYYQKRLAAGDANELATRRAEAEAGWHQAYSAITASDWPAAAAKLKILRRPAYQAVFGAPAKNDLNRINQLLTRLITGSDVPATPDSE